VRELTRRDFLKASGAGVSGAILAGLLRPDVLNALQQLTPLRKRRGEIITICPYDASGCGFIVDVQDGKVVNIEGDPDHPINEGGGCSKGQSIRELASYNPQRLNNVLYRAPNGADWEEKSWDWTIDRIARRVKDTRDTSFIASNSGGTVVSRTEAIANLGGSALDNEGCYALAKFARSLGVVYLEHHARI